MDTNSDTPFGAPEHQEAIARMRDLLKEAHAIAAGLPLIEINGVPHSPIALCATMDVYDVSQPTARASQSALACLGHQLSTMLIERIVSLPPAAQRHIVTAVAERRLHEIAERDAAVAEN